MVSLQIKGKLNVRKQSFKHCRSFKNFNHEQFLADLQTEIAPNVPSTDVNRTYDHFEMSFKNIVNKHAPLKKRRVLNHPVPYINKQLRQAIYKKRMLHNRYKHTPTQQAWEKYKTQRNIVTKLKKTSIKTYFLERCTGGPKSKSFWPTIKPFLSNKGNNTTRDVIIQEGNKIIFDQQQVTETFNNFFIKVAKDIGNPNTTTNEEHPSIQAIKQNHSKHPILDFAPVTTEFIDKQIHSLNTKKQQAKTEFHLNYSS